MRLNVRRIEEVVTAIVDRLEGEWLIVGGALVALWLTPRRVTEDIDVVGLRGIPEERIALLELADELGLPIEAVNSAADFFVRRVDRWRDEIEVFRRGKKGVLFRPSTTLFLLLKIGRLSEQDLSDCVALLRRCKRESIPVDRERVVRALRGLEPAADAALKRRRAKLLRSLAPR